MTWRGPIAGLRRDREEDGDYGLLYIRQLFVRAEMKELDRKKTNEILSKVY